VGFAYWARSIPLEPQIAKRRLSHESPAAFFIRCDIVIDKIENEVLATDLYEERLEGDEPEPMRVDKVNLRELSMLAQNEQFSE
ncbi:hypothetical protein Q6312_28655, partial [Klebsiella pneumoniae]|nr:hypothetical protein [Klebsiella pneumoniae]